MRECITGEAIALCRGGRVGNLNNPRIAHLRGLLALEQGRVDLALALLTHAIRLSPGRPNPYHDLADVLFVKGRETEALAAHLHAVRLAPTEGASYARLGHGLHKQRKHQEALAVYEEALRLTEQALPARASHHCAMGGVLLADDRAQEAIDHYRTAIRGVADDAEADRGLGRAHQHLGQADLALRAFEQAARRDPCSASLQIDIGLSRLRLGLLDEALRAFRMALTIDPGNVDAIRQYVFVLELLGRPDDAVNGWVNLGAAMEQQRLWEHAAAVYERALARKPDSLRALTGLGRVRAATGNYRGAIRHFEAAIGLNPDRIATHVEAGRAFLWAGDVDRGWDELAWHYHPSGPDHWRLEQPVWDGGRLDDRTLLLWSDTTAAETIHAFRYVSLAKSAGGQVAVECDPQLVTLAQDTSGADIVLAAGGPRPHFHVHAPLRHLPAFVRPARWMPASDTPYLQVSEALKQTWQRVLNRDSRPVVGIAWAGGPEDSALPRSCGASLSAFAPLADLAGIRLIALQRGPHRHEMLAPPARLRLEEVLTDSDALRDLAAVVANLDLIISVDSALVHLADGLGKPAWVLLPRDVTWPWPVREDTCAWSPRLRMFRQETPGDWTGVTQRVRAALESSFSSIWQGEPPRIQPPDSGRRHSFLHGTCIGDTRDETYGRDLLDAARVMCEQALESDLPDAHVFHLAGLIAAHEGEDNNAIAYLKRAVLLDTFQPVWLQDLAGLLIRNDVGTEALAAALAVVKLASRTPASYCVLSRMLRLNGRLAEAAAVCRIALAVTPLEPSIHAEFGHVLTAQRLFAEAETHFRTHLRASDAETDVYIGLAHAVIQHGRASEAIIALRLGLQRRPSDVDLHVTLGEALIYHGAYAEAVDVLRHALFMNPSHVNGCQLLVMAHRALNRPDEIVGAHLAAAAALQHHARYHEAADSYRDALTCKSDSLPAMLGLAHMLIATGAHAEAYPYLTASLKRDADNPLAHIDLATVCHLEGDLERGWKEFAWLYNSTHTVRRAFEQPLWDGSSLGGRTLLLWTSQGRGDAIQFLRYIRFATEMSGRLVVECNHAGLVPLVERLHGVQSVVAAGTPLPRFDVHAPLVLFPSFVRTADSAPLSGTPYLFPDPHKQRAWADRLNRRNELIVGLSWSGNTDAAPLRFMPLRAFEPLGQISGIRLISLQHGPQAAELLALPHGLRVERWVQTSTSIDDVAALLLNVDLLISVDTMLAHLAGALGVRVWTLLRYATNWRWKATGEHTAWYPTMRLFRQTRNGDWASVIERVRVALIDLVAAARERTPVRLGSVGQPLPGNHTHNPRMESKAGS